VGRRWTWREAEAPLPRALLEAVADLVPVQAPLVARLLWNRDVRDGDAAAAFLRPTLAHGLRSPLLLKDMGRAAARLADALAAGERVAVYGDYDVDGISGAAVLVLGLRALGADPLLHVSHREREGHGLHEAALGALRAAGARVVVTADCGTANARELGVAADLGLDVIVCDHHQTPATRPPALALLNPLQADCTFPFKGLSGAGVAFYLLMGLRMELRARGQGELPDLRRYLDLVALGTVADLVPLREENRVLVRHGLHALERTVHPGLAALKETALVESASVRALGHRLAPRLNASGRVADARRAVEMLITASAEEARAVAAELEVHNAERRVLEDAVLVEAASRAAARDAAGAVATVVAGDGWHAGVVGIVAARLAERHHRPAVVVALDGALGRGSGRSVPGVDLHAAMRECDDLLEAFGGHVNAVGFTVRRERVPALAVRLDDALRRQGYDARAIPSLAIDAETSLAAVTPAFAGGLAALEPHGPGNPEPVLLARDVEVQGVGLVGEPSRAHLKLRLRHDGRTLPAIGFGLGHLPLRAGERVDVVFTPRLSRWQGVERLRLEVLEVRGARPAEMCQPAESQRDSLVP
jgi:single-stranded-DNA-specific exonuclease